MLSRMGCLLGGDNPSVIGSTGKGKTLSVVDCNRQHGFQATGGCG